MIIAVGSKRRPKLDAVLGAAKIIAGLGLRQWQNVDLVAREVEANVPAMPTSDEELMQGAAGRVKNLIALLEHEGSPADLYVGLEGGFHCEHIDGERRVFLRGWVYVSDGERGFFGSSPSIEAPTRIAAAVLEGGEELGAVIDRVAGEHDIRSKQGTWGILTRDLLHRTQSFESALLAAFAPFYNPSIYELKER